MFSRSLTAIFLSLCFATSGVANSSNLAEIKVLDQLALSPYIQYIEDPSGDLNFEDVVNLGDSGPWKQNHSDHVNFGYTDSVYWFRVFVKSTAERPIVSVIEIDYSVLDELDFYAIVKEEIEHHYLGDKKPFSQRLVQDRRFLIPYSLKPGVNNEFIIRIKTGTSMQLPITLWNTKSFYEHNQIQVILLGVYYGMMVVMLLYNLFVFLVVRTVNYLYYLLWVGSMLGFMVSYNGIAYQFLWPNSPFWNDKSILFFLCCSTCFGLLFCWEFLDLHNSRRRFGNAVLLTIVPVALFSIILFFIPYSAAIKFVLFAGGSSVVIAITAAFTRLYDGYKPAKYYSLAWSFLLFGTILLLANKIGVIPRTLLTENFTQIGSALEVMLLSFALADRMNTERIMRELAQRESLEAQEESINSLSKYEDIYNNSLEGRFSYKMASKDFKCNDALARIFGFEDANELPTGLDILSFFTPEEQDSLPTIMRERGYVKDYETRLVNLARKDEVWVMLMMQAIKDDDGELLGAEGILTDITERKLREADQKNYEDLYENSPQGLFEYNFETGEFNCNNAYAILGGFSNKQELIDSGLNFTDFAEFTDEDIDIGVVFQLLVEKGEINSFEFSLTNPQNNKQSYVSAMLAGSVSDGRVQSLKGAVTDISERKKREAEKANYKELYNNSPLGMFEIDFINDKFSCNQKYAELIGFETQKELLDSGLTFNDLSEYIDRHLNFKEVLKILINKGEVSDLEVIIENPRNQRKTPISVNLVAESEGERVTHLKGVFTDISERKQKEAAEKEKHRAEQTALLHLKKYEKIYNESVQGLLNYDYATDVLNCNEAWAKTFGFESKDQMIESGFSFRDLESFCTSSASRDKIRSYARVDGDLRDYEMHIMNPLTGRETWVSLNFRITSTPSGIMDYADASVVDITEKKERDVAEKAKELSETKNKAKSQFFASMSHELRTPLTAILGYSDAAKDKNISNEEKDSHIEKIERGGKHLLQLVNDILDISKIEAQKLEVEKLRVNIFELIHEVEEYFSIIAERKGISFTVDYMLPMPSYIITDPTRLKQMLINICGNAVKFTDAGSVTVKVSYRSDIGKLSFRVRDTGIGLKKDQVGKLFDAFSQADSSTTRNFGGTGLGLHLSKQIAEKLGGDIFVESDYGKGSVFTISLATGDIEGADLVTVLPEVNYREQVVEAPKLRGHILYAEDNPQNQELVSSIIKKTGCTVDVVSNGKKALEYMGETHYDLVFTDIRMPSIDGTELCETILKFKPNIPVIAITATATNSEIEEFDSIGFRCVLRKPIDRKVLYQSMEEYLPGGSRDKVESGPVRVLLAEDNLDNQGLIKLHLKRLGCETVCVEDGVEALQAVSKEDFDLVLMDMEMPVMNGMTAVKLMREKGFDKLIYALTANTSVESIQECRESGCDGHLSKPLEKDKLKELIDQQRSNAESYVSNIIPFKKDDGNQLVFH